jgi:hypothetical protein
LVYADDVNLLGDDIETIKKNTQIHCVGKTQNLLLYSSLYV